MFRKTIRKDPPKINRMAFTYGWRQLCGHHVYEWSDVHKRCEACWRAVENSNQGK